MPKTTADQIDRFLKAILRDATVENTLIALDEMIVAVIGTLPPNQRRDFARKLKRQIPELLERANRKGKDEPACHHSRH
jgi:hypothetical protein